MKIVQHFTGTLSNGQIYSDIIYIYTHIETEMQKADKKLARACLLTVLLAYLNSYHF